VNSEIDNADQTPRLIAFDSVNVIGVAAVKHDNSNHNNGGSHDNGGGMGVFKSLSIQGTNLFFLFLFRR
jgi:hypothetical protein